MQTIIQILIDFIFPPSPEELRIRDITFDEFFLTVKKAPAPDLSFICSIFSYKDPMVKELIWQIKYKKNKKALGLAGIALNNAISQVYTDNTILIPIPISKSRRKERGYNQCELIIDEVTKINPNLKKDYNLLIRVKDVEKQTFKNRKERINNTSKIFKTTKMPPENTKIIIIDDVTTTGSTLKEARETLIQSGYSDVMAITISH